jgi:hypothetical protein
MILRLKIIAAISLLSTPLFGSWPNRSLVFFAILANTLAVHFRFG